MATTIVTRTHLHEQASDFEKQKLLYKILPLHSISIA